MIKCMVAFGSAVSEPDNANDIDVMVGIDSDFVITDKDKSIIINNTILAWAKSRGVRTTKIDIHYQYQFGNEIKLPSMYGIPCEYEFISQRSQRCDVVFKDFENLAAAIRSSSSADEIERKMIDISSNGVLGVVVAINKCALNRDDWDNYTMGLKALRSAANKNKKIFDELCDRIGFAGILLRNLVHKNPTDSLLKESMKNTCGGQARICFHYRNNFWVVSSQVMCDEKGFQKSIQDFVDGNIG